MADAGDLRCIRRGWLSCGGRLGPLCATLLAACTPSAPPPPEPPAVEVAAPLPGTWEWAVAGDWRAADERAADRDRKPVDVFEFLRIQPSDVVVDLWPGAGWTTAILAPVLDRGGGAYTAAVPPADLREDARLDALAAAFAQRFAEEAVFGEIGRTAFGPETDALAPPGSVDVVLSVRGLHAFMALGFADAALARAEAALRPGGYLGIIEARAPEGPSQDPRAPAGYVQQSFALRLAEEAGFTFVGASELLANPDDRADHPFGVWTLPPHLRTSPLGAPPDPGFDTSPYAAIGEPDRMLLLFQKPRAAP